MLRPENRRQHVPEGRRAHRREVGEVHSQELAANRLRGIVGQEMNARDDRIRGDDEIVARMGADKTGIVAKIESAFSTLGERGEEFPYERELTPRASFRHDPLPLAPRRAALAPGDPARR